MDKWFFYLCRQYLDKYLHKRVRKIAYFVSLLSFWSPDTRGQKVRFEDVTAKAEISFTYNFGDYTYENILESSGSGVTIFDYDNDGWMDIYLLNGTYLDGISDAEGKVFKDTRNELYRNNGDGTFSELAQPAGIDDRHWSMAAGAFDYDGDGDADIYLLNYGPNIFYRNNGDGTFTDITEETGLSGPEKLNGFEKWSVGVAFWDIDEDKLTDVMVGNFLAFDPSYVSPTMPDMMPHPSEYKGQASLFYRQHRDGTFREITGSLGFYYPESMCMGLTVYDYDHDGDLDLFQGNDHQKNFLFRNDGNLEFEEVAVRSGIAVNDQGQVTGSMHGTVGDVDGDGLIDLLVTDLKYGALYRNLGNGLYEDITRKSGIARHFNGKGQWAAMLFDYDNDGDLDIFTANGTAEELRLQLPLLLENDGRGNFRNAGPEAGPYFRKVRSGRGAAVVDYDNNGWMDIIVSHIDLEATPALLKNRGSGNNWLGISLTGAHGPASAVSALVKVKTKDKTQVLVNQPANTYLSWNDPRMHVGLGNRDSIDELEITWPQGEKEVYTNIKANRYISIVQGQGIK
ncbi:MAG: CRTAC1 family protein [Cytophagales bacterium]|nr:CRTAC1 family protein [Cytophagales bacterium]